MQQPATGKTYPASKRVHAIDPLQPHLPCAYLAQDTWSTQFDFVQGLITPQLQLPVAGAC